MAVGEARGMGGELAHGHRRRRRAQARRVAVPAVEHADRRELRQIGRHRRVEVQRTTLGEDRGADGRNRLGHREDAKEAVGGRPSGPGGVDAIRIRNHHDGERQVAPRHHPVEQPLQRGHGNQRIGQCVGRLAECRPEGEWPLTMVESPGRPRHPVTNDTGRPSSRIPEHHYEAHDPVVAHREGFVMPQAGADRNAFVARIERRRSLVYRLGRLRRRLGGAARPLETEVYDRTFRSDAEAVAYHYARHNDHLPDLDDPVWLNEKIRWQFLHHPNPLMTLAADKIAVRDYLAFKGARIAPPALIAVG
jgi:hypothetical protein